MGAAPWDESCKRQRGAAVKSVAQGTWKSYYPGLDRDTRLVVEQLKSDGKNGKVAIDLNSFVSLVAMDMGFLLSYGKTIHDLGGKSFADGFIESAAKITEYASTAVLLFSFILTWSQCPRRQCELDRLHPTSSYLPQQGNFQCRPRCPREAAISG